ncbi:adenylate kinase isoenzyme 6 [Parasteatoda tepidariorum]|uniref:adenylate kinase isoenzyme 6 n=1 Tax=Parasteatoda tepidariorum TaxID=114398 RepID=UPI00077F9F49|nr:adenylate kinase isoenzyme 6 [Parasteatoda tepidariorum]
MRRRSPNILITGTPGTGKSTLSSEISEIASLEWINIGEIAKSSNLFDGYDESLQCHILDEDQIINELEDKIKEGGKIVDYHSCDFFPEDWFDIVFVLTTDNTILYDRLVRRGYSGKKLENNIQCEIFQTLVDEAKEAYDPTIVFKLNSNTPDDMESNIENICRWIESFLGNNANG